MPGGKTSPAEFSAGKSTLQQASVATSNTVTKLTAFAVNHRLVTTLKHLMTASIARYANCRRAVINVVLSTAGVPVRPVARPRPARMFSQSPSTRSFSCPTPAALDKILDTSLEPPMNRDESAPVEEEKIEDLHGGYQEAPSTPWYLQVGGPQRDMSPLLKRQQLPKLPLDPPPLLQPMLEHISTDLGLDDLTLFDLRDIDPPPALGANLIMVLGTARSEKHLHVSADRFCRWLKRTHKLSPYADGLLGRGELKLKLRRKARRARILSNVGSSERGNTDDGIRTGWICVNVGTVPENKDVTVHKDLHDYVGFGEEVDGAKIVIQMLTQEKREELDLEDLWGKMVRRQERREARISPTIEAEKPAQEVGQQLHPEKRAMSDSYRHFGSTPRTSLASSSQVRSYHLNTAAIETIEDEPRENDIEIDGFDILPHDDRHNTSVLLPDDIEAEQEPLPEHQIANDFRENESPLSDNERHEALQDQIDRLKAMSRAEALEMLNRKDSPFWLSFDGICTLFPTVKDSEFRLNVLCYAQEIGAVSGKHTITRVLHELEDTFIDIPETVYITTVKAMLRPPISPSDLLEAATIMERMSVRGHSVAIHEIRTQIQYAILQVSNASDKLKLRPDAFQRFKRLMNNHLDQPAVEAEIRVMHACADTGNWDAFWDVWRGFARAMRPRPRELYITMFHCTAHRNHQAEAMRCLRECVPEMAYEEPPVDMDAETANAIKACLFVAEPDIGKIAAHSDAFGEWTSLWRRCNRAIHFESEKT